MPNTQNNEIIQEYYSDKENKSIVQNNNIIFTVVLLFFFGTVGYFFGVNNVFSQVYTALIPGQTASNSSFQNLTSEELDKLIDANKYDFQLYTQIVGNLKQLYVDPNAIKDEKLFEGTLKGMVEGVGDPNTTYLTKEEYKKYKESLSGTFQGVGMRLTYNSSGKIEISGVVPESPAQKAGVRPGFVILAVDGKSIEGKTTEEVVSIIRGKEGTKVSIEFFDPVDNKNVKFEIQRASIKIESIRIIEVSSDTVILEVNRFTEETPEAWVKLWDSKLDEIVAKGYSKVILDLRGNGGGFLSSAVYAAGDFVQSDKLIVTEKTRTNSDKPLVTTNTKQRLKDKKVVVLVDGDTASASEILTAAIRFHNKTKVIGVKTFGKGTVQSIFELSNGGALKVTIEYWLMPDGKKLDKDNPIIPDIESSLDLEKIKKGNDSVIEEAVKYLSN